MDCSDLLERHRCTLLDKIIGHQHAKHELHKFFTTNDETAILIIGPSGCGKTLLVDSFLQHFKITNISRPCYEGFSSHKDLETHILNFLEAKSLMEVLCNTTKCLFFDDVDVLLSHDRYVNTLLTDIVSKKDEVRNCKIVFTCSTSEERRTAELRKKVKVVRLENPSPKEAAKHITGLLESDGYTVDRDEIIKLSIALKGNLRNICNNLANNTDTELFESMEYFDMNIFSIVSTIFKNYEKSLADIEYALSSDPTLISYIMYDNFKNVIISNHHTCNNLLTTAVPFVCDMFLDASLLEDYAYKNNDWALIEQSNFIRCGTIRATQKLFPRKPNVYVEASDITYTQITTRAAQYYNNMKKIYAQLNESRMHRRNQIFIADILFEKSKNKEKTRKQRSDGCLFSLYQNNICSNNNTVYAPKITFQNELII